MFPDDVRVRREVLALSAAGHQVDVICERWPDQAPFELLGEVRVIRLPFHRRRAGRFRYVFDYARFLLASALRVAVHHLREPYDVVQVNSMPDVLVFASLVPRLLGARVVLDLHECMPEFFATRFKTELDHPAVRFLKWLERLSIGFSHAVITCTDQMRDAFVERGAPADKITVVLNSADEAVFDPSLVPLRRPDPSQFVVMSHGIVEEWYGLDTLIRAAALLKPRIPGLRVEIYGMGSQLDELRHLAKALDVQDCIRFSGGWVPMDELLEAICRADVGIVATKRGVFRDMAHCNKMFEFITLRTPAAVSWTPAVGAYFDDRCFRYFRSDDAEDLARAVMDLYENPSLSLRLVEAAVQANEPYRWPRQRERYLEVIDRQLQLDTPSPTHDPSPADTTMST